MWAERAYKTKADGTQLTLDELTNIARFAELISLNKQFGADPINILLSQSKTLQQAQNIKEFEDLILTLYNASNSTEPALNKKVKETNTFKQNINQLQMYEYNAGELLVEMWKNASEELKMELKNYPKLFLAMGGASKILDIGEITLDNKSYNFATEEVTKKLAEICNKLINFYTDTEKLHKKLNKGIFTLKDPEISQNGLNGYELVRLQNFVPIFASDIFNDGYKNKLKTSGVLGVVEQLDIVDYMTQIRDICFEKHTEKIVKINDKERLIDFVNPETSAASVSLFVLPYNQGIVKAPQNYGKIFEETTIYNGKTIKDLLPEVIKNLSTSNIPTQKIEVTEAQMLDIERIITTSAALVEQYNALYVSNKTNDIRGDSFFIIKRMDDAIKAKWEKLFKNMNEDFIKKRFVENGMTGGNVYRLIYYGDFMGEAELKGKNSEYVFMIWRINKINFDTKDKQTKLEKVAPIKVPYFDFYVPLEQLDTSYSILNKISEDSFVSIAKTNNIWI